MDTLMNHTLRRQLAEQTRATEDLRAQVAELMTLVKSPPAPPAASTTLHQHVEAGATVVNGPQTVQSTQINIEKVEIRPWDRKKAITVIVSDISAAFVENARLQEYAQLSDHSMADREIAPPYVTELLTDLVKRGHADPASRNIYLNPLRADQVLVHLKGGTWVVRTAAEGYRALLDGIASSVHEVTLSFEKRQLLPIAAQNALAMADLLYGDEPEAYVERAKGSLDAHLADLAARAPPLPAKPQAPPLPAKPQATQQ